MTITVKLPVGATLVEFDLEMPFEYQDFEFIFHSDAHILRNSQEVERQLRRVDRAHHVRILGKTSIEIRRVSFGIDFDLYFYPSGETLGWRLKDRKRLSSRYSRIVDDWAAELRPLLIGTVHAQLPMLRSELKQEVLDRAMRLSVLMRNNAEEIIQYIGQSAP